MLLSIQIKVFGWGVGRTLNLVWHMPYPSSNLLPWLGCRWLVTTVWMCTTCTISRCAIVMVDCMDYVTVITLTGVFDAALVMLRKEKEAR
mmetsp:Transcript_4487/g.7942  ORF Transcript_4487/g.7942 Transcript_4487/m.7942 type:complete len:90 (-) Transcript_4487:571-840(-)